MKDLIAKLYRHIAGTGERAPTIEQVRAALGPSSPGIELLRRWRSPKSEAIPAFEQLLYLLYKAEQVEGLDPLTRPSAYIRWCKASAAQWNGKLERAATLEGEEQ